MQEAATNRAKGVPPVLRRFCVAVAVMTLLSEGYDAVLWHVLYRRPGYGGSFNWSDAGSDFDIYRERFQYFHTPRFWDAFVYPFTYPAPAAMVYWACYRVLHLWPVYLVLSLAALAVWAWVTTRQLAGGAGTFILLLLFLASAWPVRMLLETGNIEAMVLVLLGAGLFAAARGRWWMAGAAIGLAGSVKLYPLMLLGLLLSNRRYKEFALGLAVAAAATLASLAALGPSIAEAQRHINEGVLFLTPRYILWPVPEGLRFTHQLFNFVKIGVVVVHRTLHPAAAQSDALRELRRAQEYALMATALKIYVPVVTMLGAALYWFRIRTLPFLNQVLALTVCAVLLPPLSQDYTLVQLLVPVGLLCVFTMDAWRAGEQPRGLATCFACVALIFTTGSYFELRYRFSAQVRTLALVMLLIAAVRFPFTLRGSGRAYE